MHDVKPMGWIRSSKKDLMDFPIEIRKMVGYSVHLAQLEKDDIDSKPLKGFGSAKVREVVKNDSNSTYRAVYTVEFKEVVYVLHVFKKKAKTGIKTPKQEIALIKDRLKIAQQMYKERKKMKAKPKKNIKEIEYEESSGNVFAILGFENPEEDLAKANLIAEISHIIRKKKLTQARIAELLGVNQPRVSSLLSGNLDLFSIEMLMNFLKILGQDIEIIVKSKPKNRKHAHLSVISYSERVSVPIAARSH